MNERAEQLTEEMLVSLLAEAPEEYLAADALCGKLGLPKAVVFRQIEQLRSKGYRIDARPVRGYRLLEVPDRLTSLEVSPLLATHELGRTIHHFAEIDSTNEQARRLADDGALHGELIIAEAQTAGRGRRGRTWHSASGENLTFSLVLRLELPASRAHEITLAAAVALGEVLREAGFDARIKWPNDLLIGGRKVAGILAESGVHEGVLRDVILGIGLNVNAESFPAELAQVATSLRRERGEPLPRALLLAALLEALERWLERLVAEGPSEVLERSRAWSATLGRRVRLEPAAAGVANGAGMGSNAGQPASAAAPAAASIEGLAERLDDTGALEVRLADGSVKRVTAGDVGLV